LGHAQPGKRPPHWRWPSASNSVLRVLGLDDAEAFGAVLMRDDRPAQVRHCQSSASICAACGHRCLRDEAGATVVDERRIPHGPCQLELAQELRIKPPRSPFPAQRFCSRRADTVPPRPSGRRGPNRSVSPGRRRERFVRKIADGRCILLGVHGGRQCSR